MSQNGGRRRRRERDREEGRLSDLFYKDGGYYDNLCMSLTADGGRGGEMKRSESRLDSLLSLSLHFLDRFICHFFFLGSMEEAEGWRKKRVMDPFSKCVFK